MRLGTLFMLIVLWPLADPAAADAPWFDTDWEHRVPVTADAALIDGSETFDDFALLVLLDGTRNAAVFAGARTDGADLLFTAGDGITELPRQIVHYDAVGQSAEIWVRVAQFSDLQNELYLYYAHPDTALAADPADAWSSEYRLVYHFEGDPGSQTLLDSSPQDSHAAMNPGSNWTSADIESGQIGRAWLFNGTTHHVNSSSISTDASSYTISAWLRSTARNSDFVIETSNPDFWHISLQAPTQWNADYVVSGIQIAWNPAPIPNGDGYHHFLWAFDAAADTIKFYLDGVPRTVRSIYNPGGGALYPGRAINPGKTQPVGILGNQWYSVEEYDRFAGGADEFRIREGLVSAARILTEYRSQKDNFAFLAFGAEEDAGGSSVGIGDFGGAGPGTGSVLSLRMQPNPSAGHGVVSFALGEPGFVRLAAYDLAGRRVATLVNREVQTGTWTENWEGVDDGGRPLAAGLYFLRLETPSGVRAVKITIVR